MIHSSYASMYWRGFSTYWPMGLMNDDGKDKTWTPERRRLNDDDWTPERLFSTERRRLLCDLCTTSVRPLYDLCTTIHLIRLLYPQQNHCTHKSLLNTRQLLSINTVLHFSTKLNHPIANMNQSGHLSSTPFQGPDWVVHTPMTNCWSEWARWWTRNLTGYTELPSSSPSSISQSSFSLNHFRRCWKTFPKLLSVEKCITVPGIKSMGKAGDQYEGHC